MHEPRVSERGTFGTGDMVRDARACFEKCGRFPFAMGYAADKAHRPQVEYINVVEEPDVLDGPYAFEKCMQRTAESVAFYKHTVKIEEIWRESGYARRSLLRRVWYQMSPGADFLALREIYSMDAAAEIVESPLHALPTYGTIIR